MAIKMFLFTLITAFMAIGCNDNAPRKTDFQELLDHGERMGWSSDEMKIDTVSDEEPRVAMYRFSGKIMSDWHVFYPDGQFKSYYFYPAPDHYYELSINRRKPRGGNTFYETSIYWGLLLLSPNSANTKDEILVASAAPIIGECGIKLFDENSTEILLGTRLEKPETLASFLELIGVGKTADEVSFEWFWKYLSPEGEVVEVRDSIRISKKLDDWEIEKYNPPVN